MVRLDIPLGTRFGKLLVIEKVSNKIDGHYFYICKCDCGNTKQIRGHYLKKGTKSCGCLHLESIQISNSTPPGDISINGLLHRYKRGAKRRKIEFNLSKEEFSELIKQNCYYCNSTPILFSAYIKKNGEIVIQQKPSTTRQAIERSYIYANGIDRIDSNKEYSIDNCVPCCSYCNIMKYDRSLSEFIKHIEKVLNFQKKKQANENIAS